MVMWATTSRTRQPAHSVGSSHLAAGSAGEHLRQLGALGRDHVPDAVHRCHVSFVKRAYVNATNGSGLERLWTF